MMQDRQRHRRGLLRALESGLGEEHLTDGDAVKAAYQRAVLGADLDRVGIALLVQRHESAGEIG